MHVRVFQRADMSSNGRAHSHDARGLIEAVGNCTTTHHGMIQGIDMQCGDFYIMF